MAPLLPTHHGRNGTAGGFLFGAAGGNRPRPRRIGDSAPKRGSDIRPEQLQPVDAFGPSVTLGHLGLAD
jgi:hypothetical protein